jgi:hypothetical protein
MIRPRLRYLVLFLTLASIVSLASGMVLTSYSYFPSGVAMMNYGFPLPWETVSESFCGLNSLQQPQAYQIMNGPCLRSCWCVTTYNIAFLLSDVLFYTAIGYLLLLSYRRLMRGIDRRARERVNTRQSEPEPSVEPLESQLDT